MNRIRFAFALVLATVIINFSFVNLEQKPVVLKLNLPKNTKYLYSTRVSQDLNMQGMTMKTAIGGDINMLVLKSEKGKHEIEFRYSYFLMDMNMNGQAVLQANTKNKDTTLDEKSKMVNQIFKGILDIPMIAQMNELGEISSLSGSEAIKNGMLNQPGIPDEVKTNMQASIGNTFSEKTLKQNFEQVFKIYPNKAVNIGESWVVKINGDANGFAIILENTYTLEKIKGNVATLQIKGSIKGDGPSNNPQISGMNGTQTGTISVDTKTGLPFEGKINQILKIESPAASEPIPVTQIYDFTVKKIN